MVCCMYGGTTLTSLTCVWFHVDDTQGRTQTEIAALFTEVARACRGRTRVFSDLDTVSQEKLEMEKETNNSHLDIADDTA